MTNPERQRSLQKKMSREIERTGCGTAEFAWCNVCEYRVKLPASFTAYCSVSTTRELKNYCATAYNRMVRKSNVKK